MWILPSCRRYTVDLRMWIHHRWSTTSLLDRAVPNRSGILVFTPQMGPQSCTTVSLGTFVCTEDVLLHIIQGEYSTEHSSRITLIIQMPTRISLLSKSLKLSKVRGIGLGSSIRKTCRCTRFVHHSWTMSKSTPGAQLIHTLQGRNVQAAVHESGVGLKGPLATE